MTANGCGSHGRKQAGCPACRRVSNAYNRKRRAALRDGTWKPQVPQQVVLHHLNMLLASGANLAGVSAASGLSTRTLHGIRRRQWIQGATAHALLSVESAPTIPSAGFRPAVGACRRVRALAALGWSVTEQARQLGLVMQQVWQLANGKPATVSEGTDFAVRSLFSELSDKPGPSLRARRDAARKGWPPPLAWDDIDDPAAEPETGDNSFGDVDEVAVERVLAGEHIHLTDAELIAALQAGVARGMPLYRLAKHLGLSYFSADKLLSGQYRPRKAQQERVESEVRRIGHLHNDTNLAALLDVHPQTVTRARVRLARRGELVAS